MKWNAEERDLTRGTWRAYREMILLPAGKIGKELKEIERGWTRIGQIITD